jgi:site-specific recombinase XerD
VKDPTKIAVKGPLGPYAVGFCAELDGLGYADSSAVNLLKLVAHFSQWMGREGLTVRELGREEIGRYVAARRAAGYRHNPAACGLGTLLSYLRGLGVLAEVAPSGAPTGQERLLQDYAGYLVSERGLTAGTVRYYLRFAGLFLSAVARGGALDVDSIATGDVSSFLVDQCVRRSVGAAKNLVMALRALLRYLHVAGLSATPLVWAVPAVAPWRERSVPRALAPAAVARLLESCARRTAVGQRDYAILVVLARLGLRAGEVAALELGDIDWRRGNLLVRGKGGPPGAAAPPGRRR